MRTLIYCLTFLSVIGLAFWAYQENYRTQAALDRVEDLQREIGAQRERLGILRAEWAYLNRPDRLRDLADLNFERLGLLALRAEQFGRVDQVAYPAPPEIVIDLPVDISSAGAGSAAETQGEEP